MKRLFLECAITGAVYEAIAEAVGLGYWTVAAIATIVILLPPARDWLVAKLLCEACA